MLNMERYFNEHVKLDVVTDNKVYTIQGKIIDANANITKLATYKNKKVTTRYIDNDKIVGIEVITLL